MQNYCKTIGALAAASALVAGTASAEVEYEMHAGYTNEYLFRGVDFGDDLIEAGFDAATEYNGIGLSAGVWAADYDAGGAVSTSELDVYGEASYDLGFATGAIGYIWYGLEDEANVTVDDAQEIYFSLSRDLGFAEASVAYFWDIETDNDGYAELGLSRDIELTECVTLGLSTAIGYTMEEDDWANWMTSASLNWGFAENATLSPFVTLVVDGESSSYETANEIELIGGSMLSVSF